MWRTIFIWDVHGCYKELKLLVKRIRTQEDDKVYLTWDAVNWWPKSYKVLKFLYKNKEQFKSVAWNNDLGFLRWYDSQGKEYNHQYSKKAFKELKEKIDEKKAYHLIDFLRSLPLYIEEDNFILVHWWIVPWKPLREHTEDEITCIRTYQERPWYEYYNWEKMVVYGHWAKNGLRVRKNTIWLDSGCVYWRCLTAYVLETGDVYTQNATQLYINLYKKKNENKEIDK